VFQPKPITADGIPGALAKAERYRLLNEPEAAESICLDVLAIDPENQDALVMLLLARTDLIARGIGGAMGLAREVLQRLKDPYDREYYAGIISERRGHAQLLSPTLGASYLAYDWFREAMACYERAIQHRPTGNDDALLRWNTCARVLNAHPEIAPPPHEAGEHTVVLDD
jgi:tetratricopeptide (TPR) repeat protein